MTNKLKRIQEIERRLDCDHGKLYSSLNKAIEYLREVQERHPDKNIFLHENWTGHDEMEMIFVYHSPESDEEYESRCRFHRLLEENREEERKKRLRKEEYLKELRNLKLKFGET